jgi:hypothetical protein
MFLLFPVILHSTFALSRACMVVTDAEPDRFAPLPRQRRWASAGLGWWQRDVALALLRGVSACRRAGVRGARRRPLSPKPGRRRRAARAPIVSPSERTRNRRGCWNCCAGRAGPPSPASCNRPAGSSTRCAGSLPGWCARSSVSRSNPRRRTASASTASLARLHRV